MTEAIERIIETIMGDLKKLKFKFRDHLESTEKNKNKLAINTIGMNIAL